MNGIKHEYILDGSCIVAEKWVENNVEYMMVFLYDDAGSPIGFLYRTSAYAKGVYDAYFYEKNFFGDVIGIYDESGSCVAKYNYNAWGVCTVQTNVGGIATLNPIRYRGYYYDTHTGLYYLQSRYYNPDWGRFISPDCYVSTGQGLLGNNMYLYCNNNPVMYVDPSGESFVGVIIAGGIGFFEIAKATVIAVGVVITTIGVGTAVLPQAKEQVGFLQSLFTASDSELDDTGVESVDYPIKNRDYKQAYFPVNPYDFHPNGLKMKFYAGTTNGAIIKWFSPNGVVVFEWNEDWQHGSHYHALFPEYDGNHQKNGPHYIAGEPVPEPFNTIYFGG